MIQSWLLDFRPAENLYQEKSEDTFDTHANTQLHSHTNHPKNKQRKQNLYVLDTTGSTIYSHIPSINNPHLIIRRLTDIRCADDWRLKTTKDDERREDEQRRVP